MNARFESAIRILSDEHAEAPDRIFAAEDLANCDDKACVDALTEVGGRPDEPDDLRVAIGRSLAAIAGGGGHAVDVEKLDAATAAAFNNAAS